MDKTELILNNGTILQVDITSTINSINITSTFAEVTTAIRIISTETLKNATLGNELIVNKVLENFTGYKVEDNNYTVSFILRDKTENEIITERLDEQDAALIELAEMIIG